jgi:hypothetical protein
MIFLSISRHAGAARRALGFKTTARCGRTTAVKAALPGFAAADVAVRCGRTATVSGRDGRVARVTPHGDRWVVRLDDSGHDLPDPVAIATPAFIALVLIGCSPSLRGATTTGATASPLADGLPAARWRQSMFGATIIAIYVAAYRVHLFAIR